MPCKHCKNSEPINLMLLPQYADTRLVTCKFDPSYTFRPEMFECERYLITDARRRIEEFRKGIKR